MKKIVVKLATLAYFVALGFFVVGLFYQEQILTFFSSLYDGHGVLINLYNKIKVYFANADAWNLIFIIVGILVGLAIWVPIDICVYKLSRWFLFLFGFVKRLFVEKPETYRMLRVGYKWTIQKLVSVSCVILVFAFGCNLFITVFGKLHSVNNASMLKKAPVLILGTAKFLSSGKGINLYYKYRLDAAAVLLKEDKVDYFILSGDGGQGRNDDYDETRDMREDLLAMGVPKEKIKTDTAGFRTLDSMLRLREFFRTPSITIISQEFHTPRALFLGSFYGVASTGFNAKGSATFWMFMRELRSKTAVIMDLFFMKTQPKAGVSKEKIREDFSVTKDSDVLFLFFLMGSAVTVLRLVFKYVD